MAIKKVTFKVEFDTEAHRVGHRDILLEATLSSDCTHTEISQLYVAFLKATGYRPTRLEEFLEEEAD